MRQTLAPALAAVLLLGLAPPAQAQLGGETRPRALPRPEEPQRDTRLPPGLPGLEGRRPPAPIPADPRAAGLDPTAALFDAVDRGDAAAAREAVGRGARLEARNALGLTALDSAVDQGRTDIAFYLLSIRAQVIADPSPAPAPRGRAARGAPEAPAAPSDGSSLLSALPPPREDLPRGLPRSLSDPPFLARQAPAAPPPVREERPRLFGGDGGAPRPEVGFLGFDPGRPAPGR